MQKTFYKFVTFELTERIARFRLLLQENADYLEETSPALYQRLLSEADTLQNRVYEHKASLNQLFADNGAAKVAQLPEALLNDIYPRLAELSRFLLQLKPIEVEAETYLFLKDVLPVDWLKEGGEQTVFLTPENTPDPEHVLSGVLIDQLSVLQKNNPLAWVGLAQAFAKHLVTTGGELQTLKGAASKMGNVPIDILLTHAVSLRLLGPAYYFEALAEAVLKQDATFLNVVEPALFYGVNHFNFTHKSLVILHEACDRQRSEPVEMPEETLATLFRAAEKLVPSRYAFQEKYFERAIGLQARLDAGTLFSSTPLYPVEEVAELLQEQREKEQFSIYELLGKMTEYPHSPREIVNAGWLYKIERGPVWLYSVLNEENQAGFTHLLDSLNYQDHLLRKSIETSEVHRVLLCTP